MTQKEQILDIITAYKQNLLDFKTLESATESEKDKIETIVYFYDRILKEIKENVKDEGQDN